MKNAENYKILKFPGSFLWGVSTSAYQVEGGIKNDWSEWEKSAARVNSILASSSREPVSPSQGGRSGEARSKQKEKIFNLNDFICGRACDSYNRWEEDVELVKNLNCGAYRFSIEWARIEPENGKFDEKAVEHYKMLIRKLKDCKIEPFVTLWHWTLPLWISDLGGWENKKTIEHFSDYVEKLAGSLGEDINFWITLNEPQTYTGLSYVAGTFPPQVKSLFRANKVFRNLMQAHAAVYKMLKQKFDGKAQVGISHYANYHTAYGNTLLNKALVKIMDYFRWQRFINYTEQYQDFIGFQYYHHNRIRFKLGGRLIIADIDNENKSVNDMGWEIYPEGIYPLLKYIKKYNKPIYITENGTADADDNHRAKFILDTLKNIHQAISEGVDVRGYFYWSLLDNFEWAHGWEPKFGLYAVDLKTFERRQRPSVSLYADICQNKRIMIV